MSKDRLFALFSFLAGLVFLFGLVLNAFSRPHMSGTYPLEQLGKITCQSNLLALFTSGLYFFKPDHKFFKSNCLLLFSTTLLWFAGLGFGCLLFPLYYIDLGNLIMAADEPQDGSAIFYVIWDHSVTQFLFLLFFQKLNRRKDLTFLIPVNTKQMMIRMIGYMVTWILYNVFVSFIFKIFPTYGILTNFNPQINFQLKDAHVILFNVRFLVISHILCCSITFVLLGYLSLLSTRLRAINTHSIMKKMESLDYMNYR